MYRPPPDSDTESDEFDFNFIGSLASKKVNVDDKFLPSIHEHQINDLLYESVKNGDSNKMIELWDSHYQSTSIDTPLRQGWSLLLYASYYGHLEIVKYLLEKEADVNRQIDSVTPLLVACDCENPNSAVPIVELLLQNGAFINVVDRNGTTPLMNAVKRGYIEIVEMIIKNAALEAVNFYGNTAIYFAIEKNNEKLLKLLIDEGADLQVTNRNGLTPKQTAVQLGHINLIKIFPVEVEEYILPENYRSYTHYEDLAPTIFKPNDFPAYFQEIEPILIGMKMEKFIKHFAQNSINLVEFLTITDERLENIGIKFPYQRKQIHLGLMKFHAHPWSKKSVNKVTSIKTEDTYDFFIIVAGLLRHMIILKATAKYIRTNKFVRSGTCDHHKIDQLIASINNLKTFIDSLKNNIIQSFNPRQPVLHVNISNLKLYNRVFKTVSFLTYSSILGLFFWSVFRLKRNFYK